MIPVGSGILLVLLCASSLAFLAGPSSPAAPHAPTGAHTSPGASLLRHSSGAIPSRSSTPSPLVGNSRLHPLTVKGPGALVDTLVLVNNTPVPGNFSGLPTSGGIGGITFDGADGDLYITNAVGTITVVNPAKGTVANVLDAGVKRSAVPGAGAYDSANGCVYVTARNPPVVEVFNGSTDRLVATLGVGGEPSSIAFDPANGFLYVTNSKTGDNNVTVINGSSNQVVGSIRVGLNPDAIVYDGLNGWLFVANGGAGNVSVINGSTDKVIAKIGLGRGNYALGNGEIFDPLTSDVFVSVYNSLVGNGVVDIDAATAKLNPYAPSFGKWVSRGAFDPATGDLLYLDGNYSGHLTQFNAGTGAVGRWAGVGSFASSLAYDPLDGNVYVPSADSEYLSAVNATKITLAATLPLAYDPRGIVYDPANAAMLVTDHGYDYYGYDQVFAVNGSTDRWVGSGVVGVLPNGVAYDAANGYLYIANYAGTNVSVLNASTLKTVQSISLGTVSGLYGANYDSANHFVYVANPGIDAVSVINGKSATVVATVPTRTPGYGSVSPSGIIYDPVNGDVFVVCQYAGQVMVINGTNNSVFTDVNISADAGMALDPANGWVFVVNASTGDLEAIAPNMSVVRDIPLPLPMTSTSPQSIVFDPMNGYVYLATQNAVTVVDPANRTVVGIVAVGGTVGPYGAQAVGLDLSNGHVFATVPQTGTISIISTNASAITYPVTFQETGLRNGTNWSVTLSNVTRSSTNSTIRFQEPYSVKLAFTVNAVSQYTVSPTSGTVSYLGWYYDSLTQNVTFTFSPTKYPVTFHENGLPSGTQWSIRVGKTTNSSTSSSITLNLLNGSYFYRLAGVGGWHLRKGNYRGSFTMSGNALSYNLTFARVTYSLTIQESGLPTGTNWSVTLLGTTVTTSSATTTFRVPNGTYTFRVSGIAGWRLSSGQYKGSVYVGGSNTVVTETFVPAKYWVTFKESGLPAGTAWNVTIGGTTISSTSSKIVFSLANGSYSFSTASFGYTATPASGSFTVGGSAVAKAITFT
ncbi:MAG: YncE family protein [Candidatus Lutacidiplasmatales archaeon]